MIKTLRDSISSSSLQDISIQLERIADILEAVYSPQILHHNYIEESHKEVDNWKNQATYYQESCQRKNEEIKELELKIQKMNRDHGILDKRVEDQNDNKSNN